MKVLLLSKDFRDGEGVSEYCKDIAEFLVDQGHEAAIVSFDDGSYYSIDDRVEVKRVPLHFEGDNLYNWSMLLNNELKRQARELMDENDFDIIHANDWTTVPGGVTLSKHSEKPLMLTVHSTENERGFEGDHAEMISELEWQGAYESDKVLATNSGTADSLRFDLDVPDEKIEIIDPFDHEWLSKLLKTYEETAKNKVEAKTK